MKKKNSQGPYGSDYEEMPQSRLDLTPAEVLKLDLAAEFNHIVADMETKVVVKKTGLHNADLSRLKAHIVDRVTVDRLLNILSRLGYSAKLQLKKKSAS